MNFDKIKIDGKKRLLYLGDKCLDVLNICEAMCCRIWAVPLTKEEFDSKLYKSYISCSNAEKICNKDNACINRKYVLKKKEDGSCVYLNLDNKCSIYDIRPKVCRKFSCEKGWKLQEVVRKKEDYISFNAIIKKLEEDMLIILNPLINLTLFYIKEKQLLKLILKNVQKCDYCTIDFHLDINKLNEDILLYLIDLLKKGGKLGDILHNINEKHNFNLTKEEFYKIINLFYTQKIIIFKI